jgi:hypothetical protein
MFLKAERLGHNRPQDRRVAGQKDGAIEDYKKALGLAPKHKRPIEPTLKELGASP